MLELGHIVWRWRVRIICRTSQCRPRRAWSDFGALTQSYTHCGLRWRLDTSLISEWFLWGATTDDDQLFSEYQFSAHFLSHIRAIFGGSKVIVVQPARKDKVRINKTANLNCKITPSRLSDYFHLLRVEDDRDFLFCHGRMAFYAFPSI